MQKRAHLDLRAVLNSRTPYGFAAFRTTDPGVDGGVNPRNPAMTEKLARDLPARDQPLLAVCSIKCKRLFGGPLSTPTAAEGGGRRPAFTEGCRTAILDHQERRLVSHRRRSDRPESGPMRRRSRLRNGLCAVYARILAAANTGHGPCRTAPVLWSLRVRIPRTAPASGTLPALPG
jgi:hypothetical protein